MHAAVIFLPLIGAILAGFFGRQLGPKWAPILTCVLMAACCVLAWIVFFDTTANGNVRTIHLFSWIDAGAFEVDWALFFDQVTAVMLIVVTTVSMVVHIYSLDYMEDDPHRQRFFAYLSLFTFAMLMLITADNFVQLFFGWEGVGLCSYLLIGFWYKKPSANAAAIKAFIVNRVGDFGFALGIMGVFFVFEAVSFEAVFDAAPDVAGTTFRFLSWDVDILTTLCLLLFVGAMGKSAQVPLHTWLPDAMEGPTPVSALIHAATMVTAGVFMVVRLSPMFEYAPYALMVVAFVGATTAFFAATVGIAQNDIKRVIAYSTCSQLGYMFFACGVGAYSAAIFHLSMHACFKALLFLGSGQVIHAVHGEQDMRRMGGLWRKIPITYAYMWIGSLALAGIPFFAGYFSKDLIIESAFAANTGMGMYAYWMGVGGAVLTALYSWRMIFMTFHGRSRMAPDVESHVHEAPKVMWMPLLILVTGSVIGGFGFMGGIMVADGGEPFFGHSILVLGANVIEEAHHIPQWAITVPLAGALSGVAIAFIFYIWRPRLAGLVSSMFRPVYLCLLNKYYVDELYDWMFVRPAKRLGYGLWKAIDGSVIDGLGPDGIASVTIDLARRAKVLQSGYVYHYAFTMLIGVAVVVSWFLFRMLG